MQQLMRHCLPSSQQLLHFWDWGRQSTLSPCAPPGSGDSLPRLKMMLILCERPPKTILHQTGKIDSSRRTDDAGARSTRYLRYSSSGKSTSASRLTSSMAAGAGVFDMTTAAAGERSGSKTEAESGGWREAVRGRGQASCCSNPQAQSYPLGPPGR